MKFSVFFIAMATDNTFSHTLITGDNKPQGNEDTPDNRVSKQSRLNLLVKASENSTITNCYHRDVYVIAVIQYWIIAGTYTYSRDGIECSDDNATRHFTSLTYRE